MNYLILIILILVPLNLSAKVTEPGHNDPAGPGNNTLPGVLPEVSIAGSTATNLGSINQYTESYFDKRIIQRPKTEVNQYLGDLITSFNIPLPKGFQTLSNLAFKYNSSQYQNTGYGIGFSLELPKIEIEHDELKITGVASSGPLIKANTIVPTERLKKIFSILKISKTPQMTYYLNQSGEDSSLYLQFTAIDQNFYAQLKSNGETWIFNSEGNPTNIFGIHNLGLKLTYLNSHLTTIKDLDSRWKAHLFYNLDNKKIYNYNNTLHSKVTGLKNIDLIQGDRKISYNFSYDEEYLTNVSEKGSLKKIFQAEYAFVSDKSFNTIQEKSEIAFKANNALSYSSDLKKLEWTNHPEKSGVFNVDLNGDFYLDKVVLNTDEINFQANALLKRYKTKCNYSNYTCSLPVSAAQLQKILNEIPQKLTVYIAINNNGKLVYKEDSTLSLKENSIKFMQFIVKEEYKEKYSRDETWKVQNITIDVKTLAIPKFFDIDNNGKKDIVICSNDEDIKNVERSLGGKNSGQKQNPVVVSYYNFLTKKSEDIFKEKGSIQTAFLVSSDRVVLGQFVDDLKNGKLHFVINASKLTRIDFTDNLACNQLSIPVDYNNDGRTDLLTGNKVTMFTKAGSGKMIELTKEELKNMFNLPKDLAIGESPVELIDLKNDGQLSFVESFATYIDRQDRSLVYLQDSIKFKVHRPAPVKLLVKENVNFGGYSQVDYTYHNGSALVSSILFSPRPHNSTDNSKYSPMINKQPRFKKVYEYGGSRISDQFNILLGHSDSKESTYLEDISTNQFKLSRFQVQDFDQDFQDGPLFFLSRARKNGRVLKQQIFEKNGELLSKTTNLYSEKTELGANRIFSYLKEIRSYTKGNGTTELVAKNSLASPLSNLTFLVRNESSISSSNTINNVENYDFNQNQYLLLLKSTQTFDENLSKLRPDVVLTYDISGLTTTRKEAEIESYYKYDLTGRLIQKSDEKGKLTQYTYHLLTPLISAVKEDGVLRHFDYDFVTNFVSQTSINSVLTSYKWSTDEVLLSLDRKLEDNTVNFYKLKKDGLKFQITSADTLKEHSLDGFGRVIEIRNLSGDQTIVEKAVVLNDQDLPIFGKLPHFLNERSSATLSFTYDGLGRQQSELLSGSYNNFPVNFTKISQYDNQGILNQIETLSDSISKKSQFWNNDRGQVVAHQTPSESVSFNIGATGNILGVNEIQSKYTYDEFGKLSSTLSAQVPWDEMFQKFLPVTNKTISTTGEIVYDAYNRINFIKNSSTASNFEQSISYEQSLPVSSKISLNGKIHTTQNTFDESRHLIKKSSDNLTTQFEYDQFERVNKESIQNGNLQYELSYGFSEGQLKSLAPYIASIEYNSINKPEQIEFSNNVILNINYDLFQKIESVHMDLNGGKSAGIVYNDVTNGKPSKLYKSIRYIGLSQKNKTFNYSENLFLKKQPRLNSDAQNISYNQSNLERFDDFKFEYENDLLVKISHPQYGIFKNFVAPDKSWHATCPQNFNSLNDCFVKINSDEFQVKGVYTRAIKISGKLVGVIYAGQFYPALTDHLGSLIALVTPKGDALAFEREYNEWGEKISVIGDKNLEKNIPWAFAGLIQHPFFGGEILQSDTRQYIPSTGLWGSADNLVKWNPNALKGTTGNWSPLLYAGGDPVNFIDPTGHCNLAASDGASFSMKFREELKVDSFNKWNSAEGLAYKSQAQKNLGKVMLGGVGLLATAGFSGPAIASGMAGARIAALTLNLEYNVTRVSVGMFVAKNPEKVQDLVSNGLSALDKILFDGNGSPPGGPFNLFETGTTFYDFLKKVY